MLCNTEARMHLMTFGHCMLISDMLVVVQQSRATLSKSLGDVSTSDWEHLSFNKQVEWIMYVIQYL